MPLADIDDQNTLLFQLLYALNAAVADAHDQEQQHEETEKKNVANQRLDGSGRSQKPFSKLSYESHHR